jgi:hypothetical protein
MKLTLTERADRINSVLVAAEPLNRQAAKTAKGEKEK